VRLKLRSCDGGTNAVLYRNFISEWMRRRGEGNGEADVNPESRTKGVMFRKVQKGRKEEMVTRGVHQLFDQEGRREKP